VNASSSTPFGRFFQNGVPGSLTFDPSTGGYKPYNGNVDGFNFAPDNYLSTPQERMALYVQGRYQLNDNIAFRTEALFNQRRSALQLAASPLTIGAAFGIPIAIEPGQEFNPFNGVLNRVQYRPDNRYPRQFQSDVDTWHFAGGFEGRFELFDRSWSWDATYSYSENETNNTTFGLVNIPALIAGLQPDCNADNGCVPLDIFHGPGPFTQAMANSILFVAHDALESELWNYTANITGDLFELPAGPLGFAAGYEYRRQQGFDSPDALISSGASSGNIRQPTSGGYALNELYAEFNIPVLKDLAFAELLEINLAVRYSDYSNFGSTMNPKAGFRWKPFSDLLVRGNWSKGFRAPNISELFAGNGDSFPEIVDPCSSASIGNLSAPAQGRCLNGFAGVAGVTPGYEQANSQIRITVGGNPTLDPETAITKTLGMVYSPSWAPGLDLYLDWYNIQLQGAIGIRSGQFIVNDCYLNGNASSCATIVRVAPGDIADLFAGSQNLPGGLEVEGYDFTANYKMDTSFGKFTFNWDSTYNSYFGELGKPDRLDTLSDGTLATGNRVGNYFVFDPRWRVKSNLTSNWSYGDWGATIGIRYLSAVDEPCVVPDEFLDLCTNPDKIQDLDGDGIGDFNPENKLGSRTYVDLQATWDAPWNGRISAGVNNVTDRDPPFAYSAFANTFDPQYPVPGRFWYIMYMQKF
jgi:iron complex outermembrane receptor protein